MSKRRGGSLPRQMPREASAGLGSRLIMPDLPIVAPDPLAVSRGGTICADSSIHLAHHGWAWLHRRPDEADRAGGGGDRAVRPYR